jgi:hypothetical protein
LTAFASALLENCVIAADGLKPTGTNPGSSASGNAVSISLVGSLHVNNCRFVCRTDQGQSGTEAYAIKATTSNLINSSIQCQGQAASFDFFTGTHYLQNVNYNSSQLAVGANIVLSSIGNTKAIKLLKNKAVQNKLTGVIQYFDDDGVTPVLTHTPVEDESSLTRTVS